MYSMTYAVWRFHRVAALCTAAGFVLMIAGLPALAQDKAPAPAAPGAAPAAPGAAPAAKDAGKDAKKSTQWVKLCDKITINAKPKEGAPPPAKDAKPATEDKQLCSTMFEAIESNTGQLIVSVGLQEIEGAPKQVLAVMVPLGVVIPGGVKLAVYSADQWAKAAKNETIELKDLKTVDLKFSHCLPIGCTAETKETKVSLNGFGDALTGKPVDSKEYSENRRKLMEQIRQRQMDLANKAKADEMKNLPPPPPGATAPAAPAPAPSAKK